MKNYPILPVQWGEEKMGGIQVLSITLEGEGERQE